VRTLFALITQLGAVLQAKKAATYSVSQSHTICAIT